MYVCMCMCMCMCMYVYVCMYVQGCIHVCMNACVCALMHVCICIGKCKHTHTHTYQTCRHVEIPTYIRTYVHIRTQLPAAHIQIISLCVCTLLRRYCAVAILVIPPLAGWLRRTTFDKMVGGSSKKTWALMRNPNELSSSRLDVVPCRNWDWVLF